MKCQRSERATRLDHAPLRTEIDYQHYFEAKEVTENWDFETLRFARRDVELTTAFLAEVEQELQNRNLWEKWRQWKEAGDMHEAWKEINETVQEIAKKHFRHIKTEKKWKKTLLKTEKKMNFMKQL